MSASGQSGYGTRTSTALAYLIVMRFDFKVTPELQAWGYEVIERQSTAAQSPELAEPAA